MLDFLMLNHKVVKKETIEISPKFRTYNNGKIEDLMVRGGDFYAVWIEEKQMWSTSEEDALRLIDQVIFEEVKKEEKEHPECNITAKYMWDSDSGMVDKWHKYCQKQLRDNYHMLDETIIFSNMPAKKEDYATKRLSYPLEECDTPSWDKLISTLYEPEEREKLEWAIGSIVTGDSKTIQKFVVLYGGAGTGKSTVLNIIQELFDGYYSVFDAKALGSSNDAFALESFKTNPLVAIQHDGDLSRIEDNTRLNSLVSHEEMTVNEKFKSQYTTRFKAFLFMGTNKPVKITDAKSGLIRRLIDVEPSGNKLPIREYNRLMKAIKFELGGIAWKCKELYLADPHKYDSYTPNKMMYVTNDFFNFVEDMYFDYKKEDGVTMKAAWESYTKYCNDARVGYPMTQRVFREELKNYFRKYEERAYLEDGTRVRSYYSGFKSEIFDGYSSRSSGDSQENDSNSWLTFEEQPSILDSVLSDYPAQYANKEDTPVKAWDYVKTKLKDLDTHRMHYILPPDVHIEIDFDIPDEQGNKCLEKNIEAASHWPPTYAELSKSGQGIHLAYNYTGGDPALLSRVYDDHIEIKVFTGKSSLRRKLTKCNNLPVANIASGLPLKGEKTMVDFEGIKNEKALRTLIKRNLCKEYRSSTVESVEFIKKDLDKAYESGLQYDVSDMEEDVISFAQNSTHNAEKCLGWVVKMHFKSDGGVKEVDADVDKIFIFDCEVFINLFLINGKFLGEDKIIRMINPSPDEVKTLFKYKLVGFNNKRYDNHILYARAELGYSNEQLYNLSQEIIKTKKGERGPFFGSAWNLSYTDIHDFCSTKQSLKKWEIELGIHHQELGLPWDQPVPEEMWAKVSEYCDNDVIATEALFNARQGDFKTREILSELTGLSCNTSTNNLSQQLVFEDEKEPQKYFNWRDLSKPVPWSDDLLDKYGEDYEFHVFTASGDPTYMIYQRGMNLPEGWSILPFFPEYKFENGKSTFLSMGDAEFDVGEGGLVYSEPGIHSKVDVEDVASMHPHSVIAEQLFGPYYTARFKEIVDIRIAIKHKDFEKARKMFGGKLAKYLDDESEAKALAQALKIVINAIYGQTAAKYANRFRDPNNYDNIVAKRGALFMSKLKQKVQERGFTVAHIKTDSIKIPNATPEIIQFVRDFGKEYGYTFETEEVYERMCLVNRSVYIARFESGEWTATGKQFAVPYVFKTLFSHEPITFKDMCETFSIDKGDALYLDMNETLPDVTIEEKELDKLEGKYRKGQLSDTTWEAEQDRLLPEIYKGHDYMFVGKVGLFTPIKPGEGGGLLMALRNGKYTYASGAKGYRWLESEMVKNLGYEDKIDKSYYTKLVDDAYKAITVQGDAELFLSDDPLPEPDWEENEYGKHPVYPEYLPFN